MKIYNCIIIEDEHLLAGVLANYINQVPYLELLHIFSDGVQAMEYLNEHPIDIIFIDINLPKLKGIDFIKLYQGQSKFIITTAYHEYAIEGYELNVIDYLLKPIEFNRFLMAVNKIHVEQKPPTEDISSMPLQKDYLYVNINKRRVKVNFMDITYVEGMKEYVHIHLIQGEVLATKIQLGQLFKQLSHEFVQIHRSYIVAKSKVTSYNLSEVSIGQIILPVGNYYKDSLSKEIE